MRFAPVQPASVRFDEDGTPVSQEYGDVYHARAGAIGQAQAVFIAGNELPARWRGRDRFVVLETGFGLGHNFLSTWQAWRRDPARCQRLFFASMDRHPVTRETLQRAHARCVADADLRALCSALLAVWPSPSPDLHHLRFEDGRLTLLLAHADVQVALRQFRLQADAVYLDGFSPRLNPQMWSAPVFKAVARLCPPQATLATWSAAGEVQRRLCSAGFAVQTVPGWGGKREQIRAERIAFEAHTLRQATRPAQGLAWRAPHAPVVVVGAGLAGAACALALSRSGVACLVLERGLQVAAGASGNQAGLFHGVLHAQDGAHARFIRAAAWMAAREYASFIGQSEHGAMSGLERLESGLDAHRMQALIETLGLPQDYVQALGPDRQGQEPRWLYAGGGWIDPRAWVNHALSAPGIEVRTGAEVHALERIGQGWVLRDPRGAVLARTGHVVLCQAAAVVRCLPAAVTRDWPTGQQRGQITRVPAHTPGLKSPKRPRSGRGFALALPNGDVWCGASASLGDEDSALRLQDHIDNLRRLASLTGSSVSIEPASPALSSLDGRVGWRFHTDDRLPMVGPCPAFESPAHVAKAQAQGLRLRDLPSEPGLFLATALGSRGITAAPLIGALLAAQLRGDPLPLPSDLVDALDPRRFALRTWRRRP